MKKPWMNLLFSGGIPQNVAGADVFIMRQLLITDFSFINQPLIQHGRKKMPALGHGDSFVFIP